MTLFPLLVLLSGGCATDSKPLHGACAELESRRWQCVDEVARATGDVYMPLSPSTLAEQCTLYQDREAELAACSPLEGCDAWATCITDVAKQPWQPLTSPNACGVLQREVASCGIESMAKPHIDACEGWRAGRRGAIDCLDGYGSCETLEYCLRFLAEPPPVDRSPAALALAHPAETPAVLPVVEVVRLDEHGHLALNGREIGEPGALLYNAIGNTVAPVQVAARDASDRVRFEGSTRVRWLVEVAPNTPSIEVLLLLASLPSSDELWIGLTEQGDPVRVLTTRTAGWSLLGDHAQPAIGAVHIRTSGTGAMWLDAQPMWFGAWPGYGEPEWLSAQSLADRRLQPQGLSDPGACQRQGTADARREKACVAGQVEWPAAPLVPGRAQDGCLATAKLHRDAVNTWPAELQRDLGPLAIPAWVITPEPGLPADVLMATLRGLGQAGAQELRIDVGDRWAAMSSWRGPMPTGLVSRPQACHATVTTPQQLDAAALAFAAESYAWSLAKPVEAVPEGPGSRVDPWRSGVAAHAVRCVRQAADPSLGTGTVRARGEALGGWIRSVQLEGGNETVQRCTRSALDEAPPGDGPFQIKLVFRAAGVPRNATPGIATDAPRVPWRLWGDELQHLWWVE